MIDAIPYDYEDAHYEGVGTEDDPYLIPEQGIAELFFIAEHDPTAHYELNGDIDLSETHEWDDGAGWFPIGHAFREDPTLPRFDLFQANIPFRGRFDGRGYTISNLHINRPEMAFVGLFSMHGGEDVSNLVTNLHLENVDITAHTRVGVLASTNDGVIDTVTTNGGSVEALDQRAGGVVDSNYYLMRNVSSDVEVTTGRIRAGGITSSNYGIILDAASYGDVTGPDQVGGISGMCDDIDRDWWGNQPKEVGFSRCYSEGTVWVVDHPDIDGGNAGGVVGDVGVLFARQAPVYIEECITSSDIHLEAGDASFIGGIAGIFGADHLGFNPDVVMRDTIATGSITADHPDKIDDQFGRLVGICSLFSNGTLQRCLYSGEIDSAIDDRAGVFGLAQGTCVIEDVHWDGDKNEVETYGHSNANLTMTNVGGKSTDALTGSKVISRLENFDWGEVWTARPNANPVPTWRTRLAVSLDEFETEQYSTGTINVPVRVVTTDGRIHGEDWLDATVTVTINGAESATRQIRVKAGKTTTFTIPVEVTEAGQVTIEVATDESIASREIIVDGIVCQYTDESGYVHKAGLSAAMRDWRRGQLPPEHLSTIRAARRTGDRLC